MAVRIVTEIDRATWLELDKTVALLETIDDAIQVSTEKALSSGRQDDIGSVQRAVGAIDVLREMKRVINGQK